MKKLSFLLTAWLVHAQVFCFSVLSEDSGMDMESIYDGISEELLQSLENSLSQPSERYKRELSVGKISLVDDSGVHRLTEVKPVTKLCHPDIYTLFIDVLNTTYCVCISAATEDNPAQVLVGIYEDHTWTPSYAWFVENPESVAAFHFQEYLYVLVADSNSERGVDLVKINLETRELDTDHTINSRSPTSIAIWKMRSGVYNLALANSASYPAAGDFSTEVFVYKWEGAYFNHYFSFRAHDVKDIEPFQIYGTPYLAVANFRRGKNINIDSQIFRYNLDSGTWVSHQKIRTYGAMDWESFTLGSSYGKEFFLAVANKGDDSSANSMIYKFVDDKFVPFQCLQTTKATSIASFSTESIFLLAVANEYDAVHLYQYDGWRFVKSAVQYTKGAMSSWVTHLEFHEVTHSMERVVILSVSNPKQPWYQSVFEIRFRHENALSKWHKKAQDWCTEVLTKIENSDVSKSIDLDGVFYIDQPTIVINGDLVFEKGFDVKTLKTNKLTKVSTQEIIDDSLVRKLADLQRRLEILRTKLNNFSGVLQNALKVEGDQTITGRLEFENASFDCKGDACQFRHIDTENLNGERVSDWSKQLVFLDEEQYINGTLMAEKIDATSVHVSGLIDGIESENLVTKSGSHTITGYKAFSEQITAKEIKVAGMVDGVIISPENVLLATGHQVIHGNLTFEDVQTAWLTAEKVNGRNFTAFLDNIVLTNKHSIIRGEKTFTDVVINKLEMTPGSRINGVDLADLWKNTLWIDGNQEVKAEIIFSDVMFQQNLNVPLGINEIEIPGPRIVDITEPAFITAPHEFKNSTLISNLQVTESLNGISMVPGPGGALQLDIMMKSGDQIVTGAKTFHTIHLDSNSDVDGTVDGVDLSELRNRVLRKDGSHHNGHWVFNNFVVKGPLTVGGKVSGINLKDIYNRALRLDDAVVKEVVFRDSVKVTDLQSNSINGVDFKNDIVLVNERQTITGKKTFQNIVLEANSFIEVINGLNLSIFNDILFRLGNQEVKSKIFRRNVVMKGLTVTGSINGIPVTDIITLKGGQSLGSRVLKNVTFNEVRARNVEIFGTVNGINLEDMIRDTMTYDDYQTVSGRKAIKGTVYIRNNSNLQTSNLNGKHLSELWNDAVLIDVPQNISAHKTFIESVAFNNLYFKDNIDGVTDWDMKHNWVMKDEPQTIEGEVIFKNGFSAKDLNVDVINGIDIKDLESSVVKLNEPSEVEGPVIFENTVASHGDVSLSGKIQGIDLSEEAVLRNYTLITGEKTFAQDVVIEGDITVDGTVDGLRVEDLCSNVFIPNKAQNVSRLTIKGNVTFQEGVTVGGNLAGVDLKLLHEIAVKKDGSEVTFTGRKKFLNVTFEGPVTIKGKIGGEMVEDLAKNYMSLTKNQEVMAPMNFTELAFKGVLSATNLDSVNKEVNNINILDKNNRILKTSGTQIANATYYIDEVVFSDDLVVAGKVDGLKLPSDLMRHNHTNFILSPKIFQQPLFIFGNLEMERGSTIQGIDVSEWYKRSVLNHGKFVINGFKTFHELVLTDVKAEGMFDGLKISEDFLLMAYGNQAVTGAKLIVGSVNIEGSLTVNGLINRVNLTHLVTETLQRDKSIAITGLKTFTQPLTIVSLKAPTVAGVDVVKLQEKLNTSVDLTILVNKLEEMDGVVSHMQEAFDNQAVLLQYYELFDEFDITTAYNWLYVSGEDCGELLLLSDSSSSKSLCSSLRIFGYEKSLNHFVPARQELLTSYAISVKSLKFRNSTYLFIANQNPNSNCSASADIGKTTTDIYMWDVEAFKMIQSLSVYQPSDMVVFKDGQLGCLVVLEFNGSTVYCASEKNPGFSLQEVLYTRGGRKASVIRSRGKIVLAIAADDLHSVRQNYMEGQKYIDIYEWNSEEYKFSLRKQVLQSTFTESLALMNYADHYSESLFLVVAEASIPKIHNVPRILIYRYVESSPLPFQKYQEINDYGVLEWIKLRSGELIFFAVDSQRGLIKLYQYKGASGFVKIDTIRSLGTTAAHAFVRSDPEDWLNHYLAVVGPHAVMAQPTQGVDYAKILKSKVKGRRPFY